MSFLEKTDDAVMDKELYDFFNKFLIKCESDDISLKFKTLPKEKQIELFNKYLVYFFKYTISSSVRNFNIECGIDTDYWDYTGCPELKEPLHYVEISYQIETITAEDDSFNLRILYTRSNGHMVFRAVLLYLTYDLFETGAIGFLIEKPDEENQKFIGDIFTNAYNSIMADDELHVWFMLQGSEDLLRQVLLEKNFNFNDL